MTDDSADWEYKPDGQTKSEAPNLTTGNSRPHPKPKTITENIQWQASEYIEHQRGAGWYAALLLLTIVIGAVIWLVTKDVFAVVITALAGLALAVFSLRKPQQVTYGLGADGLSVGEKNFTYNQFQSFSIIREGGLSSINLVPVKRFMPVVSIYFEPSMEPKIVEIVGHHLPFEQGQLDGVERLSRRLRF